MTDEELRDLQERVSVIREMVGRSGWIYAMDRVAHQINIFQNQIILGKAKDHQQYKEWVAYTDGLSFILQLPDKVQSELDRELARREEEGES